MKKAIITGITGQDGSYLAELLLKKSYEVHGIIRRTSTRNTFRIEHLLKKNDLFLHYGDLTDSLIIDKYIKEIQPDEVYNLGAQSHVKISFDIPEFTANTTGLGALRLLEAIKNYSPKTKYYQASSSEMFGLVQEVPQNEKTIFHPRSPYGVSKLFAHWMTINYREAYNIFASNGILYNHESPRRGENFVTRKITLGLVKIKLGIEKKLFLGNMDAQRDWGYAKDYVKMMYMMLQHNKPDDFVVATGQMHSVREFIKKATQYLEIPLEWSGKGKDEIGINKKTGETIIEVNPEFYRPAEVEQLLGDASKAKKELGWVPETSFEDLVKIMVDFDLRELKRKSL